MNPTLKDRWRRHHRRMRMLKNLLDDDPLEIMDDQDVWDVLTIEEAFLAETILPDKTTVAETMLPQVEAAYSTGSMPPLLPYYRPHDPGDPPPDGLANKLP